MIGPTDEVIDFYANNRVAVEKEEDAEQFLPLLEGNKSGIRFTDIKISNQDGHKVFQSGDKLKIELLYENDRGESIQEARIVITVMSKLSEQILLRLDSDIPNQTIPEKMPGSGKLICETDSINLAEGAYLADIDFLIGGTSVNYLRGGLQFEVETTLEKYNFKKYPDKNVCDYIIKYNFKFAEK